MASKNSIARRELSAKVADRVGISKTKAEEIITLFFEEVETALSLGQEVNIPSFFKLQVVGRKAREVRNPVSGEKMLIPARKSVKVKVSKNLNETVNPKDNHEKSKKAKK